MRLMTAYLYVTLRCNARCSFCRIWREQNDAPKDLPLDLGIRLLDDLRRLGVRHVDFTGGEPTLYGPLPDLIQHAKKIGLFTSVTTNGLMYDRRAEEISGILDSLGFSLNGPYAEIHDKAQGIPSFEKTKSAIKLAVSMKEPVHAHFTASDQSIEYMDATIDLARGLGAPLVIFPEFSYFGNNSLTVDHLDRLMKAGRKPGVCVNTASVIFQLAGGNDIKHPICSAGRSALAIAPDGSILLPCFHQENYRIHTNGNLFDTYSSTHIQALLQKSGRYGFCQGCTNWCYINPSFVGEFNRFTIPHILSGIRRMKEVHGERWISKTCQLLTHSIIRPKP